MNEYLTNIIACFLRATDTDIDDGTHWYDNVRALATQWADGDTWKGAGVIAAYSVNTPWWRNLELAKSSLELGFARADTLTDNALKAQLIIDGAPVLPTLHGPKITAFASAIADPNSSIATVDSHAYSIAKNRHYTTKEAKFGIRTYREIAAAYSEAAELAGYSVSQLQAITWVSWRKRHPNKAAQKGE